MITNYLNSILPIYILVYFLAAFVVKSIMVAKQIGKSPFVLPKDDSAYGLIGLYFKMTMISLGVYSLIFAFFPELQIYCKPIQNLENNSIQIIGISLLLFALVWTIAAQHHMRLSWRIGIDLETKTELITTGIFKLSRNPIFLGMISCMIGLFLVNPNAVTLILLIISYLLIQIQIRLEEDYLAQQHGEIYAQYKLKVRRYL